MSTTQTKVDLYSLFKEKLDLYSYMEKTGKNPKMTLSDKEKDAVYDRLIMAFAKLPEISICEESDPEYQIEQLQKFNEYSVKFYESIRASKPTIDIPQCLINAQIIEIEDFQNSGRSPRVDIPNALRTSVYLMVVQACQYQQALRSKK